MRFQIYLDEKQEYRWRLWSANNEIVATPGEGYKQKQHCIDAVASQTGCDGRRG